MFCYSFGVIFSKMPLLSGFNRRAKNYNLYTFSFDTVYPHLRFGTASTVLYVANHSNLYFEETSLLLSPSSWLKLAVKTVDDEDSDDDSDCSRWLVTQSSHTP